MDLLLICRDASASALVSNLALAVEAKKAGSQAAVFFTGEALLAMTSGAFLWPRELMGYRLRLAMADNAKAMGLPTMGRGESRQIDAPAMIKVAADAGVPLYACPLWTQIAGLSGKLPQGVAEIEIAAALKALREAKTVVGSL